MIMTVLKISGTVTPNMCALCDRKAFVCCARVAGGSQLTQMCTCVCSEKVEHFVFEHNFTITSSIFLQFSVTVTE